MSPDTPSDPNTGAPEGASPAPGDAERLLEVGLTTPGTPGRTPPPAPESLADQFPQFEILEVLGQGGMGIVYKARQRKLDRLVALKVLPRELGEDPAFDARFAREGRTLARLQHPHIVGVHDFGEADGQSFLVMEYVDGVNLRALMDAGELTAKEALAIVPQICDALQYAHDEGVVHRDIKPENVMLDRQGNVKVADFGLAKMAERAPGDFTLTGTDQVMGTLHYMAPEQYKTPQDVDHRADIFSLGVVFYEMLTGELPVGRFEEPSKSGGLDARIDEIVMRTLEREREQRYQHAREVGRAVTTFSDRSRRSMAEDEGVMPPLRRAVGEVEQAAKSLWDKRPRRTDTAERVGTRRWSRWAITSVILLLLTPAAGGATYGLVQEFARFPNSIIYDDVAGWTVSVFGFGITGVVAIIAIAITQFAKARVRGQWLSIGVLVLCVIGVVVSLVMWAEELERSIEQRRAYSGFGQGPPILRDPRALPVPGDLPELPREVTMVMDGDNASEAAAIQKSIVETLESFAAVVSYEGTRVEDLVLRRLYDAEDLETLQGLSGDADDEKRAAGAYGLGMWARHAALFQWRDYQLDTIHVDATGDAASVRLAYRPSGAGGRFLGRGHGQPPNWITFPMKRSPHGWVFAIGPVQVR